MSHSEILVSLFWACHSRCNFLKQKTMFVFCYSIQSKLIRLDEDPSVICFATITYSIGLLSTCWVLWETSGYKTKRFWVATLPPMDMGEVNCKSLDYRAGYGWDYIVYTSSLNEFFFFPSFFLFLSQQQSWVMVWLWTNWPIKAHFMKNRTHSPKRSRT